MKFWFTSDLHLGHANIIKFCNRPFKDVDEMDKVLIRNWNARVNPGDSIFHLGDFCYINSKKFKEYYYALSGNKIFIKGNHDGNNGVRTPIYDITIHHGGENILLTHRPEDIGYFGGKLALCGHVHNNWKFQTQVFYGDTEDKLTFDVCNVGVDVWNFMPIDINEIMKEYKKWKEKQ